MPSTDGAVIDAFLADAALDLSLGRLRLPRLPPNGRSGRRDRSAARRQALLPQRFLRGYKNFENKFWRLEIHIGQTLTIW